MRERVRAPRLRDAAPLVRPRQVVPRAGSAASSGERYQAQWRPPAAKRSMSATRTGRDRTRRSRGSSTCGWRRRRGRRPARRCALAPSEMAAPRMTCASRRPRTGPPATGRSAGACVPAGAADLQPADRGHRAQHGVAVGVLARSPRSSRRRRTRPARTARARRARDPRPGAGNRTLGDARPRGSASTWRVAGDVHPLGQPAQREHLAAWAARSKYQKARSRPRSSGAERRFAREDRRAGSAARSRARTRRSGSGSARPASGPA